MNAAIDKIIEGLMELKEELSAGRVDKPSVASGRNVELLHVKLEAYWTDAEVNGVRESEDIFKLRMPGQKGGRIDWEIDPETGRIDDWPIGTTARTWYKVVDRFSYDYERFHYGPDYVPNFFSIDDKGYGDYVHLTINADGTIKGWSKEAFLADHNKLVEDAYRQYGEKMLGLKHHIGR